MADDKPPRDIAGAAESYGGALELQNTETIKLFLLSASSEKQLSPELRDLAAELAHCAAVPYKPIRRVWSALSPETRPPLRHLFAGARFVLASPKPREKSEELKDRLRKLQEMAERKAYEELVRDVAPKKDDVEPFSSYKDQIGFGLHVVVIMFTGYLVGYAAFRALFNHSAATNAAGGILGLVGGMLVETVLFIIRTSDPIKPSTSTAKLKKQ